MSRVESAAPNEIAAGRQCARCRQSFPIESGTHPMELIGWWTCPSCTLALLPARHRATTAANEARPES
jgi:hypothetical protein